MPRITDICLHPLMNDLVDIRSKKIGKYGLMDKIEVEPAGIADL
jgi:hypothetical protein